MDEQLTAAQAEARDSLIDFGRTYQGIIGADNTIILIKKLTEFAKNNAEAVLTIEEQILKDPSTFNQLTTPEGVKQATEVLKSLISGDLSSLIF